MLDSALHQHHQHTKHMPVWDGEIAWTVIHTYRQTEIFSFKVSSVCLLVCVGLLVSVALCLDTADKYVV